MRVERRKKGREERKKGERGDKKGKDVSNYSLRAFVHNRETFNLLKCDSLLFGLL